jgi:hypothetical protein
MGAPREVSSGGIRAHSPWSGASSRKGAQPAVVNMRGVVDQLSPRCRAVSLHQSPGFQLVDETGDPAEMDCLPGSHDSAFPFWDDASPCVCVIYFTSWRRRAKPAITTSTTA